jgi:hypothetical protein
MYQPFGFYSAAGAAAEPTTDGLVLYLDGGSTDSYPGTGTSWTDISPESNGTFSLTNSPTFTSGNDGFFSFNGTNQYATYDTTGTGLITTEDTNNQWAIECVFRTDVTAAQYRALVTTWGFSGGQQYWFGQSGNTAGGIHWALRESVGAGNSSQFYHSSQIITSTTQWYHMVATVDYVDMKLNFWLNNSHVIVDDTLTVDDLQPYSGTSVINVGRQNSGASYFNGDIAVVRMYDQHLISESEIEQNYNYFQSRGYDI